MKKCGELYEEKNLFEIDRVQRVMTAKETMHVSYCPFFLSILFHKIDTKHGVLLYL